MVKNSKVAVHYIGIEPDISVKCINKHSVENTLISPFHNCIHKYRTIGRRLKHFVTFLWSRPWIISGLLCVALCKIKVLLCLRLLVSPSSWFISYKLTKAFTFNKTRHSRLPTCWHQNRHCLIVCLLTLHIINKRLQIAGGANSHSLMEKDFQHKSESVWPY